jgi:putative hydrolase of the HAD superfamily
MTQSSIDVVLFDLGNVILPFSHYQIVEKLVRFSLDEVTLEPAGIFSTLFDLENGAVNLYETGKMSSAEFFDWLRDRFRLQISFDEFANIWNDIFTENLEVSEVIRSLKGIKRLGLLSNTNALHFDYVLSKFPVVHVFDRWFLSHEVGFKKPDPEIYRRAIEWASVEPEKILFIDDAPRNVEAAVSLGIQGIHFTSVQQMKEELSRRLNLPHPP